MKIIRTTLFAALGLGALAGAASGNAFNINEHDARVTGRGGATAASNNEPSSIVFNPGGIAISEGTSIALGSALYIAQGSYENADGKTTTDSSPSVVPNFYVTSRLHDLLAVGVGFHLPFGLAVSWPENHPQANVLQDQNLRTYFISPVIGLNLNKYVPGLSIGGGVDIVPATIELESALRFGDTNQGTALLAGEALGIGGRFGVMYHPPAVKGLKIGAMYRSKIKLDFEGNGDFDVAEPFRALLPPDSALEASITLPQSVSGGIAYSPIKNLELEFNVVWINWAQAFENGDLTINFESGAVSAQPQDYENRTTFRFGVDYALPAQKMAVRAGFIYDPTPIPDTTLTARLPDINRKNITLGASRALNSSLDVHLGLLWVTPGERDTADDPAQPYSPAFKGTYGVQAFVASLGFVGRFGGNKQPAPPAGDASIARK